MFIVKRGATLTIKDSVGGKIKLSALVATSNPNYKRTVSYNIISGSNIVSL